jgi:hypothetical protein
MQASLREMRRHMLTEWNYTAGVFIGGMEGVEEEYRLLKQLQPQAKLLPIASTGGAALCLFEAGEFPEELKSDITHVGRRSGANFSSWPSPFASVPGHSGP